MFTKEMLLENIRSMGVKNTDYLTVHTSLKSVGAIDVSVKSGAEVLIDALKESVSDGLLMIPAHTFATVVKDFMFDVRNTKPCVGAVPCVAVQMANKAADSGDDTCIRSMHPSHSIVALGKNAKQFAWDDRFATTRNPMSGSYGKLYDNSGKILLIGVGLTSNTFIHAVDETIDTEVYKTLVVTMTDYDGETWEQTLNLTAGPGSSTFDRYTKALEEADAITYGKIGDADSMLVDARKCFAVVEKIRRAEKGMN